MYSTIYPYFHPTRGARSRYLPAGQGLVCAGLCLIKQALSVIELTLNESRMETAPVPLKLTQAVQRPSARSPTGALFVPATFERLSVLQVLIIYPRK